MKKIEASSEKIILLNDPDFSMKSGLFGTGIISFIIHIGMIVSLILVLRPTMTENGLSVYRVTLRALPNENSPSSALNLKPPPGRNRIQRENHAGGEMTEKEAVLNPEKPDREVISSHKPETVKIHAGDQKQPPRFQEEERVKEPIPFPMAAASSLETDLILDREDDFPIFLPASQPGERQGGIAGTGSGRGAGQGGPGGGSGDGPGFGRAGAGGGGFQKGGGIGGRGSSGGIGDGSEPGQGGYGRGGSGTGGLGVPRPRYAENPKPLYPREAREKGYQGVVLLKVEVLSNGHVGKIDVKKSSGFEVLDQSALAAVKKWRFIPATKGEAAIPLWVSIPIKFELQ